MIKMKYMVFIAMLFSSLAFANDTKNYKVEIGYEYFKQDIGNVSVTPKVLTLGLSKNVTPRIALGAKFGTSLSENTSSESFRNASAGTNIEIDYVGNVESEIEIFGELFLNEGINNNFNPYLKLAISSVKSEIEVVSVVNSGASNTTTENNDSSGLIYGAGFLVGFGKAWSVKAEFADIAHDDETSATKLTFGLQRLL